MSPAAGHTVYNIVATYHRDGLLLPSAVHGGGFIACQCGWQTPGSQDLPESLAKCIDEFVVHVRDAEAHAHMEERAEVEKMLEAEK